MAANQATSETEAGKIKSTSSVRDINANDPPFGSRFLTDESNVWLHNAWDHVPPPDDQQEIITASLSKQRQNAVPCDEHHKYNDKPARHWDNFYKMNSGNFFRNRKWLHNEFPELVAATQLNAGPKVIAEIGCGAGNAVFPLLSSNSNPELALRAFDYSNHAVKLVQHNPLYDSPSTGSIKAAVWDLTSEDLPTDMEPSSVDIVILVFVFSALHPDEWPKAISNIHRMLKPGGLVVFRDYGRYDLTQLRFKSGRLLDENFYIRGDKTRVYFFELDELALLFTGSKAFPEATTVMEGTEEVIEEEELPSAAFAGPSPSPLPAEPLPDESTATTATTGAATSQSTATPDSAVFEAVLGMDSDSTFKTDMPYIHPSLSSNSIQPGLFAVEQLGIDRRLLVNRKRQLKMYRVWMQGKFRKL